MIIFRLFLNIYYFSFNISIYFTECNLKFFFNLTSNNLFPISKRKKDFYFINSLCKIEKLSIVFIISLKISLKINSEYRQVMICILFELIVIKMLCFGKNCVCWFSIMFTLFISYKSSKVWKLWFEKSNFVFWYRHKMNHWNLFSFQTSNINEEYLLLKAQNE